jgi:hypothetical protein
VLNRSTSGAVGSICSGREVSPGHVTSAVRSRFEKSEEPIGPDHIGSQCLGASPELAIRRDKRDLLIGRTTGDRNEHVVAAADGVLDRDTIGEAWLYALARLALEDHDHRWRDPLRGNGRPYLVHERTGCPCSVPPPAGWAGSDHVGCVDQKHRSSLLATGQDQSRFGLTATLQPVMNPDPPNALATWSGAAAPAGSIAKAARDGAPPAGDVLFGSPGPAHAHGELRTTSAGFPATKVVGCGETHSRVLASCAASSPDTVCRETVDRQPTRDLPASLTVMVETDPTSAGSARPKAHACVVGTDLEVMRSDLAWIPIPELTAGRR